MSQGAITPTARLQPGDSVHLMLTCLCDAFFPRAAMAAVRLLESRGYGVVFEEAQTCCSQPAFNSGDWGAARRVARHFLDVFSDARLVVSPSGSCTAMVRWGFPQLFRGEPEWERAVTLARRTWELTEFLTLHEGLSQWPGRWPGRVALHKSCHLRELQPNPGAETLLRSLSGLELLALRTPEQCCGFGGAFTVNFPWTSNEMGRHKLADLRRATPDVIASTDMGCVMHLAGLAEREGAKGVRMCHYAEILAESLESE